MGSVLSYCMDATQDKGKWRAVVNVVMKLRYV